MSNRPSKYYIPSQNKFLDYEYKIFGLELGEILGAKLSISNFFLGNVISLLLKIIGKIFVSPNYIHMSRVAVQLTWSIGLSVIIKTQKCMYKGFVILFLFIIQFFSIFLITTKHLVYISLCSFVYPWFFVLFIDVIILVFQHSPWSYSVGEGVRPLPLLVGKKNKVGGVGIFTLPVEAGFRPGQAVTFSKKKQVKVKKQNK